LIRQDDWQGMQGEPSWMTAAINHFTQDQEKPIQISYWGEALTGLNRAEIDFHEVEMPMQLLAKGAVACNFNLLQGSYKPKSRNQGQWKQWRVAAILTVVALSTALIDKSVELSRLTQQKQNLDQQIEAEFKRAFPETTRIVNVRSQMTQKMEALEREGSGVSVLSMMSQLSPAFADSQVKPQNLKFDNKRAEIRFQAVAQSFEALDKFRQLAESSGFEVQQGAINNSGERVIGSISVKS
jgi:general secretion pathway protein L